MSTAITTPLKKAQIKYSLKGDTMSDTKDYVKTKAGFFLGDWHEKDAILKLSAKQAKYGLQDGSIALKGKTKAAKTPAKDDSKA